MALSKVDLANQVENTLGVATGGTGVTTAADLANTGNMAKLSSVTCDNTFSTMEFDNTLITDTYKIYLLMWNGCQMATDEANYKIQVSEDNGSSYITSNVYKRTIIGGNHSKTNDTINTRYGAFDGAYLAGNIVNQGAVDKEGGSGYLYMYNLRDSAVGKAFMGGITGESSAEAGFMELIGEYLDNDAVVNNFKIVASTGNYEKGVFTLYGIKN